MDFPLPVEPLMVILLQRILVAGEYFGWHVYGALVLTGYRFLRGSDPVSDTVLQARPVFCLKRQARSMSPAQPVLKPATGA